VELGPQHHLCAAVLACFPIYGLRSPHQRLKKPLEARRSGRGRETVGHGQDFVLASFPIYGLRSPHRRLKKPSAVRLGLVLEETLVKARWILGSGLHALIRKLHAQLRDGTASTPPWFAVAAPVHWRRKEDREALDQGRRWGGQRLR
jgi:hypothetical protein